MTVTAFDLQAFALWRVFGRDIDGTAAIIDIGEKSSQFVVVKDGAIRFIRLLPVGGITLTRVITSAFSVESAQAERLKEESSVAQDSEIYKQGGSAQRISGVLREGLTELIREVNRSLNFYATQERQSVERIILSGGTSKLNGITDYCQEKLGIKAEIGVAQTGLPWQGFDPAYAVALGLAMRGIEA
jgi:type IV pilus assembly protein PilM